MCESVANGRQRCAFHARPRFRAATPGTQEWETSAADYAATPTGRQELEVSLSAAAASGEVEREAALRAVLRVGEARRAAYVEVRDQVAALRQDLRAQDKKSDKYAAAEMLSIIYSVDTIIDRGEDVFFDEDNPVEIAAARQLIIDLDTAAAGLSPGFKRDHPEIEWKELAMMRNRQAHNYDVNRGIVWGVLVVELPKIRASLRRYLSI